ncbi:MAG: 4-hydroxybenzoate octaprenyltransferase [Arenicellales bacterium WSBS_2016_MAG_OTU3]
MSNAVSCSVTGRPKAYARLMRMDKPIGCMLLLWPTLWALWLAADGLPQPLHVIIFAAGVFIMRSAGCVMNDYADREFDAEVKRTQNRPLATGEIQPREAIILFVVLSLIALLLVSQLNGLTIALSVVGALLAFSYPFFKRFTHLPQAYLGIAFGWGIPMAYAAELNTVPPEGWLLLCTNIIWAMAYDTEYAMVDRDDDLRIGVKSTAILFGDWDRHWVGVFLLLTLALLALIGQLRGLNVYYFAGLVFAAVSALWQLGLIKKRQRDLCFKAFLHNAWFGAFVFCGLVLSFL